MNIDQNIKRLATIRELISKPDIEFQKHIELHQEYTTLEIETRLEIKKFQEKLIETSTEIENLWNMTMKHLDGELDPNLSLSPENSLANLEWLQTSVDSTTTTTNSNTPEKSTLALNPLHEMEKIVTELQSNPPSIEIGSQGLYNLSVNYLEILQRTALLKPQKKS